MARTAIGTWCACARRWRPMRSPLIEATCACQLSLDAAGRSGAENMAIDAALLDRANGRGRRFWRLSRCAPPCLSLGRNEPAARYDHTEIARRGIDVVRRPTGGRAVWHEHEVTYAVAAPVATFGSLRHAYHTIHERIAAALRSLGADATLAPPPTNLHHPRGSTSLHLASRPRQAARHPSPVASWGARRRSGRETRSCSLGPSC